MKKLYAIRNHDSGVPTGYFIGAHGPVLFYSLRVAREEAEKLNNLPHAQNRVYVVEQIED